MKKFVVLLVLICLPLFLFAGCSENPEVSAPIPETGQPDTTTSPAPTPIMSPAPTPTPTATPSPAPVKENEPYDGMTNEEIRSWIESRHGVTIVWGGDEIIVETEPSWNEAPCSDPGLLRQSLIIMDEQLELYPEGFFEQMPKMHFILSEWLKRADGITVTGFTKYDKAYTAIFLTVDEYMLDLREWHDEGDLVVYAAVDFQSTLHHEIGHAVFEMTGYSGANVYDFQTYFSLLPDGFTPAGNNITDDQYKKYIPTDDIDQVYFCSLYAMTNPAEFMAELFCFSMNPQLHWTFASPHIQAQLSLFFEAIREAYDSVDWPEQTYWERALQENGP